MLRFSLVVLSTVNDQEETNEYAYFCVRFLTLEVPRIKTGNSTKLVSVPTISVREVSQPSALVP
ncbi:MAG: hypothetical protein Q8R50_13895, partial [Sediminibacterium sp.]|nr:hypothetical protein [Sediminibacterium sp.]